MTAFRNNSIKFKQEQLTDAEVLGIMGHTATRATQAQEELAHITGLAVERGLIELTPIEAPTELPPAA